MTTRCGNLYGQIKVLIRKGKQLECLKEKHSSILGVNPVDKNKKEHQTNLVRKSQQTETTSLKVVSHVRKSIEEKSGMYKEYVGRAKERDLIIQMLKYSVNNITKQYPFAPIIFSVHDLDSFKIPHLDPLVIKLIIANAIVSRVLVDGGSNSDIIF